MSSRPVLFPEVKGNARYELPPIRSGSVYCSPWCGADCTWAAHQKAQKQAVVLARALGPDWRPRVWENMGWHHSAVHGSLSIADPDRFICFANLDPQFVGHGATPLEALADSIRQLRGTARRLRGAMRALGEPL